jgi:hypothetical protein
MMEEKALLAPGGPAIQEAAAVRALIRYINRRHGLPAPESNEDLPEILPGQRDQSFREGGGLKCPPRLRLSGALS